MERFKKEIMVNNAKRTFEFVKMKNMSGEKFFITSQDSNKNPIAFSLIQKDDGSWKLTRGALRWLYEIETDLSNAIRETKIA